MVQQIDAPTLAAARADALADAILLDVREAWEFQTARIDGSVNLPMSTLGARVREVIDMQTRPDQAVVVICHHGGRSMQCAHFLQQQGVSPVINLHGGIDAWSLQVDPAIPRY